MRGLPRLSAIIIFLALAAAVAHAQKAPSIEYRAKGVVFYVNDDGVRLREGPGTSYGILKVLPKGTIVVPVETSDPDDLGGAAPGSYVWYHCVLENTPDAHGWIYGHYVSVKLALPNGELWVMSYAREGGELVLQPAYIFKDGVYARIPPRGDENDPWPKEREAGLFAPGRLGFKEICVLRITKEEEKSIPPDYYGLMLRGTIVRGPATGGAVPKLEDAVPQEYGVVTLGQRMVLGSRDRGRTRDPAEARPQLSILHDLVTRECAAHFKQIVPITSIRVDDEGVNTFTVRDGGRPLPSSFSYCTFLGWVRGSTVVVTAFVSLHPDGTSSVTPVQVSFFDGDWKTSTYMGITGEEPSVDLFSETIDSPDLPVSLIHMVVYPYEGIRMYLWVTNGFVFQHIDLYQESP